VTTLGMKRRGDRVNIETDILGKYITTNLPKVIKF
jgi:riboflavin synthase alpha subunit